MPGFVSIVGAGPWAEELLTLGGARRLARADVVVADYLVNPNLLLHCRPGCEVIQRVAGPRGGAVLDQAAVSALLLERAKSGKFVVRLKGGDPCMFGRGGEEAELLAAEGIAYEMVPGVSSPIAAPEAAGIPVTHRHHTPAVTFVSGFEAYEKSGLTVAWEHLAKSAGTIVLMMSVRNASMNAERLIAAGRPASTPAAVVRWGTRGVQQTIEGTLGDIAAKIEAAGIRAPAVLVVGDVVTRRNAIAWRERLPLFGRRVVITRPRGVALALAEALTEKGADVLAFPCLEITAPADPDAFVRALQQAHDTVVLSSRHGVDALVRGLAETGRDLRALAGVQIAAVGDATAAQCRTMGIRPDIVPEAPRSEGLAAALAERGRLGGRVLHVRAERGRDTLKNAVESAGGTYTLAIGYRSVRPPIPPMVPRSLLPPADGGEGFDAVAYSSGHAASNLFAALTQAWGEAAARQHLGAAKQVAIGPVTAKAISRLGLHCDVTAQEPSDAGMVSAIERAFSGV